jgi:hypothetical protein
MAAANATPEYEEDDIVALSQILESEIKSHATKGSLCFAMFAVSFAALVLGLVLGGARVVSLVMAQSGGADIGEEVWLLQLLIPLATVAVSFFGAWWGVQNCVNSIERTLFAARARRHKLFATFVQQIQCADQKKKKLWVELVKGVIA